MDYDDNDFHSQKFHLAGEGSTKFPPVLRPYALPKFDFDDSLQSQLRFDSLVEAEVFLGIESNQDNDWIEDFSRGSSGIEFNSSAAESCSISRRDNVWSEATSSESVEMLLKSVGQEEIVVAPTIVEESDACDELGCLKKQMEQSLKHDDNNILSKTEDVTNLESTLTPDEIAGSSSSSKRDVGVDHPLVEDAPQTQGGEIFNAGSSHDYNRNADSGVSILHVSEGNIHVNKKCDDSNKREVDALADQRLDVQIQEDPLSSKLQVDNLMTSMQNIITSSTGFINKDVQLQTCDASNENSEGQVSSKEAKIDNQNIDGNVADIACDYENPLCSATKVETVAKINLTEVSKINAEELSSKIVKGHSVLPTVTGTSKGESSGVPVKASKCEDLVLSRGTDIVGDQPDANMLDALPKPLESDAEFKSHVIEVSNTSAELPSFLEPKKDHVERMQQLDSDILVHGYEASLSSFEETKISSAGGHESSKSHMEGISNMTATGTSPSAELSIETIVTGPVGASRENLSAEGHVPLVILTDSTRISEKNNASGESDVYICNRDVSISEKENTELSNDSITVDSETLCKEVGSSSFGDGNTEPELNVSTLQGINAAVSESDFHFVASDGSALVSPNLASHEKSDGISLPHENGVKINVARKDSQISAVPLVGIHVEEKEEARTKVFAESSVSSSIVSCQVEAAPGTTFAGKVGAPPDTAGELLSENVDQSLQTRNEPETRSDPQDAAIKEVSKECNEMNISPVLSESSVRESRVTEAVVVPESYKEPIIEKYALQDAANASETSTNKDKVLTAGGPLPLVESGTGTCQKVQECNEAILIAGDKSTGQAIEPNTLSSSADHGVPTSSPVSPKLSQNKRRVEKGGRRNTSASKVIGAGNVASNTGDPKGMDASKEGKTGSLNVSSSAELSKGDAGKNLQRLPASPAPRVVEGMPSNSILGQVDPKIAQNISQANPQVSDAEIARGRSKGTAERKARRSSAKAAGKDSAKKGINVKETTSVRQSERGDKSNNVSPSPSGIFHLVQSNEMQHYGNVEGNSNKPYFVLAASTSSLPDLNSSASPTTVFQQPFTDFQQVQLRAQIFVYGALIQGTPPEEVHMLSAFGGPDGGRSIWGNAWQACIERLQSQKSNPVNPETPLHSRHSASTGARTMDQVSKQSALQSKGISTPVGRSSTKGSQAVVSPMIPLSSPLWSMSTTVGDAMQSSVMPRGPVMDYQQALTPLHSFQAPPMRNLLGPNTSWMSQTSFRGPWVAPPQPSLPEASTRLTTFPGTEAVQLTPVKETAVPPSSGTKHVSSSPIVPTGASAGVFIAASPVLDLKKVTSSPGRHTSDPKSRKRKKNSVPEEISQTVLQSQPQREPVLAPVLSSGLSASVAITTPSPFVSQATSEKLIVSVSPTSSCDPLRKADHDVMHRAILSEDTLSKIKEASKQAEDAASLAAAAVGHSQEMWNRLEKQKNSGLVPDVEAKLASAAVAVAAAAAVAKAAAAAANVASSAALQAKLMADEAFVSNSFDNPDQSIRNSSFDRANVMGKATPASILRGEDGANSSSSIITAAREAARRRVEAASAASKRAENMDAIVRAAELAAEAVSQAGKIVAMGEPLPFSELIEAGPEGYWRARQVSSEPVAKSTDLSREQLKLGGLGEGANTSKHSKDGKSGKKETQTVNEKSTVTRGVSKESIREHLRLVDGTSGSAAASEKEMRGEKGHKVSDLTNNIVVVLESESVSKLSSLNVENEVEKAAAVLGENSIKEGSKVEVFKDGDGFKAAWYTADVLSLNDAKACVSYTEIEQNEGSAELKEWVALEGEGNEPPKIRIARPVTAMRYEGTRKRRRSALGDYNCSVGDRVDAWMANSWWEGVVTEKNKKDETSVTVHFPAQGETSAVKAWHLRPSLVWKNGEWVEWSNLQNESSSQEGDIPQEKRQKLGSPAVEAKGKDKTSKSTDVLDSGKPEESRLLDLSGNDKVFNIGKNSRNESKPDTTRMARTGLQKEGSRVIFGVPKPGKKRKFMEVSKHYVADQSNKNSEANDSIKYLKYMAPQGAGSRALKNDSKEKRVAESKLRGLKSGKQQIVSGRTAPQKENFTTNAVSTSGDGTTGEHSARVKDSLNHVDNTSRKPNAMETGSFSSSDGPAEGPFVFSSVAPTLDGPSKKTSASTAKVERANRGKLAPASGKLGIIEEDTVFSGNAVKSTSEVVEPRRSNRRIQPTSRLLEGLQSSLIIPKFPSIPHDKGHRGQNRNISRGNNHHG